MRDTVILVDDFDREIGEMEKLEVHQKGLLHRAFSVFLFNSKGQVLLQQRAKHKYHTPGLWTNTCCSHPRPQEKTHSAALRRLIEEMDLKANLNHLYTFKYKAEFDNGLIEHEMDHVFYGVTDMLPTPNPEEVCSYKYWNPEALLLDIEVNESNYTPWFKLSFPKVIDQLVPKFKA